MNAYETLLDALSDLKARGYTADLSLDGDTIDDKKNEIYMQSDDFDIDEFYRFEGESDPSDMSIIYAISSDKHRLKGVLINAYGTYADDSSSTVKAKLHHYMVSVNLR